MSRLDRRSAVKLAATVGLAGLAAPVLSACDSARAQTESPFGPVTIGLLYPQTGVYKSNGDDLNNGFQLYLKLNAGQLGGRSVRLVTADEGETPASGKAAAERLVKEPNMLAFVGVISSAVMTAIRDLVENAHIPLVGSNASPSSLAGVKYIWRTSWNNDDPGKALGRYVAANADGTVALMAADYQAGHDFVEGFKETFLGAGGRVEGDPIWTPFVPTPTLNFEPYLSQLKTSRARALFCFYAGGSADAFVKQYRQMGLSQTIFAPGFLTEGAQLRNQGSAALGIYTALNYAADLDNPANRLFATQYWKVYRTAPTTWAMAAWDAASVLDKAIRIAGTDLTPVTLNAALGRVGRLDSPRGGWEFNQNRTPYQRWYLRQVRPDGPTLGNSVVGELGVL